MIIPLTARCPLDAPLNHPHKCITRDDQSKFVIVSSTSLYFGLDPEKNEFDSVGEIAGKKQVV